MKEGKKEVEQKRKRARYQNKQNNYKQKTSTRRDVQKLLLGCFGKLAT